MFTGERFPRIDFTKRFNSSSTTYELIETQKALEQAVIELTGESVVSLDTETNSLDPFTGTLFLVQVASPDKCYIINYTKVKDLTPLKYILEQEEVLVLGQNIGFDYKFMKQHTGIELINVFDTMLAESVLTAGKVNEDNDPIRTNLEALSLKYLNLKMDKSVRKTFQNAKSLGYITPEQLKYAALDALALFPIYSYQLRRLIDESVIQVADLESRCVIPVAEMELAGCLIDTEKWRLILEKTAANKIEVENKLLKVLSSGGIGLQDLWGNVQTAIDLNSPTQIKDELSKIGIWVDDTMSKTLERISHPVAKLLLEYRKCTKIIDSFGENLLAKINKATGRIHPSFRQYGAATGRFSCSEPNTQQIDRKAHV